MSAHRSLGVDTAVAGSGAVALAHALFASRTGPVVLCGRPAAVAPAVERVPAPLLTLLLELGITPPELGVDHVTTGRSVAWDQEEPGLLSGPACAHLDRAALQQALWQRVHACANIRVVGPLLVAGPVGGLNGDNWAAKRLVDATGRRALTARRHIRPTAAWVATCCTMERRGLDPTMMLAAGPTGYAYRLGSARWLTVGWVGPDPRPRDMAELRRRLEAAGAGWLGPWPELPDGDHWLRRVASVGIPVPGPRADVMAIGDAALARDALASQGTAIGLSDARLAARPDAEADIESRHHDGLDRHLRSLYEALNTCRFRGQPAWAAYRLWVARQLAPAHSPHSSSGRARTLGPSVIVGRSWAVARPEQ